MNGSEYSTNLLSIVLKKGVIRVDLEEYNCYEDFSILQCFKCLVYGYSAKICNLSQSSKNCSADYHYKDCSSLGLKPDALTV